MVILDTNIIIELFKNNNEIKKYIRNIGIENLSISIITVGELYFGAFNKSELQKIKNHLQFYKHFNINNKISDIFIELMTQYSLSNKPYIGDMLIAATAIYYDLELFTLNQKDFVFLEKLKLYKKT